MKTIGEIRAEFASAEPEEYRRLYEQYGADSRSGVQKVLAQYRKKADMEKERLRSEAMKTYE